MLDNTHKFAAEDLILHIARLPKQYSLDKVEEQRDYIVKICKDWIEYNRVDEWL